MNPQINTNQLQNRFVEPKRVSNTLVSIDIILHHIRIIFMFSLILPIFREVSLMRTRLCLDWSSTFMGASGMGVVIFIVFSHLCHFNGGIHPKKGAATYCTKSGRMIQILNFLFWSLRSYIIYKNQLTSFIPKHAHTNRPLPTSGLPYAFEKCSTVIIRGSMVNFNHESLEQSG